MLWLILPRLDKLNLGVFRQLFSSLRLCVAPSLGFIRKANFPRRQNITLRIKHVLGSQSSCLFIVASKLLSHYDCYNSTQYTITVCVCACVYAWRRFYDAPCSWATYSSSEKLPYKSVLPRASCEDTLLLHNMVTSASVCQPKQRSGNNRVYIPTSSLCEPTCFVIISLPLLTSVEVHKPSFC